MLKKIMLPLLIASSLLANDFISVNVETNTGAKVGEGIFFAYLTEVKSYIKNKVKLDKQDEAFKEIEEILMDARLVNIDCVYNYCTFDFGIEKSSINKKISKYYK